MEFEKLILEVMNKKMSDGSIEELIEKKIEKGINEALEGIFGYCGEGKKLIESKLKEVIVPTIEKHDFNEYIVKMDTVLTEIVNRTSLAENKQILEAFGALMEEPESEEIQLSKIFEKYSEHVASNVNTSDLEAYCEDGEPYYESVTATMESDYSGYHDGYCEITFSCEEDEDLEKKLKLYKSYDDTWRILSGTKELNLNSLSTVDDFDILLMRLNRSFTKIDIDTDCEQYDEIEPVG